MSIDDIIKYIDNMPLSTIFDTLIINILDLNILLLQKKIKINCYFILASIMTMDIGLH